MAELSHGVTGLVDGTRRVVCRGEPEVNFPSLQDGSAAPGSVPTHGSQLRMGLSLSLQGVLGSARGAGTVSCVKGPC